MGGGTEGLDIILAKIYGNFRFALPWLLPTNTNVYVYNSKQSYVRGQFRPPEWSVAIFEPNARVIVMFEASGQDEQLKRDFSHEYTHLINDVFFNRFSNEEEGEIFSPPLWLDEGMAVNMEDTALSADGWEWANDLKTLDFRPAAELEAAAKAKNPKSAFSNVNTKRPTTRTVYLLPFKMMMDERSLDAMNTDKLRQNWYLQAYAMVKFLWKPQGTANFKFKRFVHRLAGINPDTNRAAPRMTMQEALEKEYSYKTIAEFEKAFWKWLPTQQRARGTQAGALVSSEPSSFSTPRGSSAFSPTTFKKN